MMRIKVLSLDLTEVKIKGFSVFRIEKPISETSIVHKRKPLILISRQFSTQEIDKSLFIYGELSKEKASSSTSPLSACLPVFSILFFSYLNSQV